MSEDLGPMTACNLQTIVSSFAEFVDERNLRIRTCGLGLRKCAPCLRKVADLD
jgi:hypothetical protein